MFIASSNWKPLGCVPVDEWINRLWPMCTAIEYYPAIKRSKLLHRNSIDESQKYCTEQKKHRIKSPVAVKMCLHNFLTLLEKVHSTSSQQPVLSTRSVSERQFYHTCMYRRKISVTDTDVLLTDVLWFWQSHTFSFMPPYIFLYCLSVTNIRVSNLHGLPETKGFS